MNDPVAFSLGPLAVRWYGIMAALGLLAAVFIMNRKRKYAGLSGSEISDLLFFIILSGIGGARFFYVIQFWSEFRERPLEIIRIDHGGLVFYGGFLAAVVVVMIFCRRKKLSVIKVLDTIAPALAAGHALGRIGCFLNGCCYGKPSTLPFAYLYSSGTAPATKYPGIHIHPVQLYESAGNIIIFVVLFYLLGKMKKGMVLSLYLIMYGTLRFLDEFLRGDHSDFLFGVFTPAQIICLFIIPAGLFLFFYFKKQRDENEDGARKA
jgi:phosphatidylglycerol:prolipoprotein diacylglycerol transferase